MSLISKIKIPGDTKVYDLGVDWQNIKDKPDVGSVDVGVTNEVLNIDTNDDIAIVGDGDSSSNTLPDYSNVNDGYVLRKNDADGISWDVGGLLITDRFAELIFNYIADIFQKIIDNDLIRDGKTVYYMEVLDDAHDSYSYKALFARLTSFSSKLWPFQIKYYSSPVGLLDYTHSFYTSSLQIVGNSLLINIPNLLWNGYLINGTFHLPFGQNTSWDSFFIGEIVKWNSFQSDFVFVN